MVEHPARAGLIVAYFQPGSEIVRMQMPLYRQKTEGVSLRIVECNGAPVERDNTTQGLGNRLQQRLLRQVGNNGVVDLKENAIALLALLERGFRPFSFRDVFREAQDDLRHTLGAGNKRNVGAPPD